MKSMNQQERARDRRHLHEAQIFLTIKYLDAIKGGRTCADICIAAGMKNPQSQSHVERVLGMRKSGDKRTKDIFSRGPNYGALVKVARGLGLSPHEVPGL